MAAVPVYLQNHARSYESRLQHNSHHYFTHPNVNFEFPPITNCEDAVGKLNHLEGSLNLNVNAGVGFGEPAADDAKSISMTDQSSARLKPGYSGKHAISESRCENIKQSQKTQRFVLFYNYI